MEAEPMPIGATFLLNQGFMRLVDHMGSDLSVVRNARVSYAAAWRAGDDSGSDTRLIKYLMENGHNTPFESVVATFEIKAPIFVIRQWQRHRTQSYNELSGRYRQLPSEYFLPEECTITMQSDDNKQMRTKQLHPDARKIRRMMDEQNAKTFRVYEELLMLGCPRELARNILPLGTYTHMFATASLWNWTRFLRERMHEHAQYEIQVYAFAIHKELTKLFPVSMKTFTELNT